jgi:hypothetical protein
MRTHAFTATILAASLAAAACGNNAERSNRDEDTSAANRADIEKAPEPISLTGCLQRGDRGAYIVTRVNEPSRKGVATSGSPAADAREHLGGAANAFRVEPKDDIDMDAMLGKQVSVSGMVIDRAELPALPGAGLPNEPMSTMGQSGTEREDIDQGDLAKVEATSISVVSETCGSSDEPDRR